MKSLRDRPGPRDRTLDRGRTRRNHPPRRPCGAGHRGDDRRAPARWVVTSDRPSPSTMNRPRWDPFWVVGGRGDGLGGHDGPSGSRSSASADPTVARGGRGPERARPGARRLGSAMGGPGPRHRPCDIGRRSPSSWVDDTWVDSTARAWRDVQPHDAGNSPLHTRVCLSTPDATRTCDREICTNQDPSAS